MYVTADLLLQTGGGSDQVPLISQIRVLAPSNRKPVSQVKVTLVPNSSLPLLICMLSDSLSNTGQSTIKQTRCYSVFGLIKQRHVLQECTFL